MPNPLHRWGKPITLLLLWLAVQLVIKQGVMATPAAVEVVEERKSFGDKICPADLTTAIDAIISRPEFMRSRWGILIQPLADSAPLYSLESERFFIPASNIKLFTTAAALRQLGEQYRIRTPVYGTGTSPYLTSLRIVGQADPSLSNTQLTDVAQQLKGQGVRLVQQLIVEDGYTPYGIINPTWEWSDSYLYYGASVNRLILNQNTVGLTLLPQQPGKPLRVSWSDGVAAKQWRVDNRAVTGKAGIPYSVEIMGVLGEPVLVINGQLAADAAPDFWGLAVRDPAHYFLESFRRILEAEGIAVIKALVKESSANVNNTQITNTEITTELAAVESLPLALLLKEINQQSNNLYAEALLHQLETEERSESSPKFGLVAVQQSLTELGVDPKSYSMADGSGLSRHNLASPFAIAQTLRLMAQTPLAQVYRESLATAEVSGTLRDRFRDTAAVGKLQAKTGTLSGVSALSGYLDIPDYQTLVLSILVNQSDQSAAKLRNAIDEIVLLLTRLGYC
ncbi:D-alanyl-D-alanine carboxypeptidase/D-alanyl-D-alanine-endopeptidase [Moorena sp. SIO3I6]|uniref:D-alanyl-D-alanine carboxypeptidase/D-alanyl-D-alanine endopeptidase n=1 Tax=Moorena sp. SIO3I6 TaxID=2607831 RepID=UPI0013FA9D74|nr:D-alanyl-D-alanine carboxypeptidase/D-alanyl-D-alanine-endopeptidase [Moorena sp. SIO3I6]NEP26282.1 D-alanyl-D-alanine carboxypeptidase/D-alanyl-D-alanine-endopeptidase [Moorena sp. SIO3I6]